MKLAIDAGADDFSKRRIEYEIYTSPDAFEAVLNAMKNKEIEPITAEDLDDSSELREG